MAPSSNPGNRPRKGIASVLIAGAVVATAVTAAVVGGPSPAAEASGLETFRSCAELSAWGESASARTFGGDEDVAVAADGSAPMATTAATAESSAAGGATAARTDGEGATNTVVEGVDELDLVEQLGADGDVVLVASASRLAVVDLAAGTLVAGLDVPYDAQVTYDAVAGVAWVVGHDEEGDGVLVQRLAVDTDGFGAVAEWRTAGFLVDARRIDGELHVVASDGFTGADTLPFRGDPVPCEQVLRPEGPSDPTATLLVTLPVDGALQPLRATEVVGSGQLVHVTTDAAYLATPQWDQEVTTTIHRFDLASLTYTGSGRVPGTLLNDFSMSESGDHLRVAVTADGGGRFGGPMPIEPGIGGGDVIVDGAPVPSDVDGAAPTQDTTSGPTDPGTLEDAGRTGQLDPVEPDPTTSEPEPEPTTTIPEPTTLPEPTTTVPEPTTTVPEPTTTTVPETTTTSTAPEGPVLPGPKPGEPRNAVIVLDLDGSLDMVGHTPWFGLPDETLHGIRFDGDVAYAVTFLQTDPFYVLDLADPTAPRIEGEVKLPGFSSYLHPLGPDRVVGFGPGEDGKAAAKLFDVSDRTAPKVLDTVVLGDESAIAWDHHAFVDLGDGRFAVPASSWRSTYPERCTPEVQEEARDRQRALEEELAGPNGSYSLPEAEQSALYDQMQELEQEGCLYPGSVTDSSVVVLALDGGRLVEQDRQTAELTEGATRAIPSSAGWALLGGPRLVLLDDAGDVRATLDLA